MFLYKNYCKSVKHEVLSFMCLEYIGKYEEKNLSS